MKRTTIGKVRHSLNVTLVTGVTIACLVIYLAPFAFMVLTSLKTQGQISEIRAPIWPAKVPKFNYNGKELDVYTVPLPDGSQRDMAALKQTRTYTDFIDITDNPEYTAENPYRWEGYYGSLRRPWKFSPTWENYKTVWEEIKFPRLLWNTMFYAIMTNVGVLISCTLVAFGFSRFRFPGRDFLFILLISTMFLPGTVTLIPTYTFFQRIGWVGTWLPLIVPSFFANPYDAFLMRQYFLTLPRELDEAAMIDGASPLRILWSVILPQSWAVIVAVTVFHIVWAWNDYFGPLIYLSTKRELQPISVALSTFNGIYGSKPYLIQAGALMALILPVILFFAAQRFFIQGIVITGVEK